MTMERKTIAAAVALLVLGLSVSAETPRMKFDVRWTYSPGGDTGAVKVADGNGDGRKETYIGLLNNTVIALRPSGERMGAFYLGNASQIGAISSIDAGDIDGDGAEELIFGLAGAREVRTYDPHDFVFEDTTVSSSSKVLYQVVRNHGAVYVTEADGRLIWRYLTDDSVKAVSYVERPGGSYIAAGVGDIIIHTYNQRADESFEEWGCTSEDVVDEVAGFTSEGDCRSAACCEDLKDCRCRWDDDLIDEDHPDKGTVDICYRSYDKQTCGYGVTSETGWVMKDYKTMNGTLMLFDQSGRLASKYPLELKDNRGDIVKDADNIIRDVEAVDLDRDMDPEIIVSTNSGLLAVLNITNASKPALKWKANVSLQGFKLSGDKQVFEAQIRRVFAADINKDGEKEVVAGTSDGIIVVYDKGGKVMWRQRLQDSITGIASADVEGDGVNDLIVSARNGIINDYDAQGTIRWEYKQRDAIYGLEVLDFEGNELTDMVVYSTRNVTRYETNDAYIRKYRADMYYNLAQEMFMKGDYTEASIYVDKAADTYRSIDARDDLPKCDLLRRRIDAEFRLKNKAEADRYYNIALKYYAINDLETALKNLDDAQRVYQSLGDDDDVRKCERLRETIREEVKAQQKLIADGYYNKAVSLISFGNYSGAMDLLGSAKAIYAEYGFVDETVKCDDAVITIADSHFRVAKGAFEVGNWETAVKYALLAKDLYYGMGAVNSSYDADDLARRANESLWRKPDAGGDDNSLIIYIAVAAIALAVVVGVVFKLRAGPKSGAKIRPQLTRADEELQMLEKEEE